MKENSLILKVIIQDRNILTASENRNSLLFIGSMTFPLFLELIY
jgi:hypothetical protein